MGVYKPSISEKSNIIRDLGGVFWNLYKKYINFFYVELIL